MPVSMAIWPEAVSGSMLAMKKGLTDLGPFVLSVSTASAMRPGPPTPEPKTMPMSSELSPRDLEAAVGHRLLGAGDAEDDVLVGPSDGLEVHPVLRLEVVDLAGRVAAGDLGVPAGDAFEAGVAVAQVRPGGVDVGADGADDAEAGDGDAAREVGAAHGSGVTP